MVNAKAEKRTIVGVKSAFKQWAYVLTLALLMASAGNLALPHLLLALGLATLAFTIIGGRQQPFFIGASLVFLPALLIYAHSYQTLELGSPAWQFRLGGLLVSVWISGLVYIVLASIVRFVGIKRIRRFFSPSLGAILIGVLLLMLLPRIYVYSVWEPLLANPAAGYKYYLIAVVTIFAYVLTTMLSKHDKASVPIALLIGLAAGLASTLISDAVEVLWLSKDIANTLFSSIFTSDLFSGGAIVIYQDIPGQFAFWNYLHFDWESILLVVPFAFVSIGEHIESMTAYAQKTNEASHPLHADKTILSEGIAVLVGGMVSGCPQTVNETVSKTASEDKPATPLLFILLALLTIALASFTPITTILTSLPDPLIGGLLLALVAHQALISLSRYIGYLKKEVHPSSIAIGVAVLIVGVILASFELVSYFTGQTAYRLLIGTVPIPFSLILILGSFAVNSILPRFQETSDG